MRAVSVFHFDALTDYGVKASRKPSAATAIKMIILFQSDAFHVSILSDAGA